MLYVAIIGDIKRSKSLNDRMHVQKQFKAVLEEINHEYRDDIASRFDVTLGDEFQGLLNSPRHTLKIIKYIQTRMYPATFRMGVGIGDISTEIVPESVFGADGPAYYAAREMVKKLHENEEKNKRAEADILFAIYNKESFEIEQINTMLALTKVIEDRWKPDQRLTIWDMIERGGSQQECAVRMNTNQSTIGRRLKNGNFYLYKEAMDVLDRSIKRLEEDR